MFYINIFDLLFILEINKRTANTVTVLQDILSLDKLHLAVQLCSCCNCSCLKKGFLDA